MKNFWCFTLFIVVTAGTLSVKGQPTSSLTGKVLTADEQPIVNAHITIDNNHYHTVSDTQGMFDFSSMPAGTHKIVISHVGYKPLHKTIELDNQPEVLTFHLKSKRYQSSAVVVTATRTPRDIEEVPEPVTVISDKQIEALGNNRLSTVLAEQTGLSLTSNHGTGLQVQGFTSEYTKIMINGQPLIGRTAGTFNLDRITVGNIKQIEIIKGPSSALWGSDALAGVVNIITQEGTRPFELGVDARYGTNQTMDLGLDLSARRKGWKNDVYFNRNSSQGYSLSPNALSQTVPEYANYTGSYHTEVTVSDRIDTEFQGRYYRETQNSIDYLGSRDNPTMLDGEALQEDYSLSPTLHFNLASKTRAELSHYFSRYRTDTQLHYQQGDSLYNRSKFDQYFNKTELQLNQNWNAIHATTAGAGYKHEQLKAKRYAGSPIFNSYFGFIQHEWMPNDRLDIIGGLRYDAHSEYSSQLSPKLSARYELFTWLDLRASAGSGFKAPDFRQLFLNFTNPTVGYSVFGSSNLKEKIRSLQADGKIKQILQPLDQLKEIKAEHSWAYNVGLNLQPKEQLSLRINLFRNNVNNLIESAPIAHKTNGQSVFSYFNLEEVYTQGIEAQLRWNPVRQLKITAGYQLLDARRKIEETKTVQDDNGEIVEKNAVSYEPMFNRSKHTANLKVFYNWQALDIDANIRGKWHGKYGRMDTNGNNFVDSDEYQDGYMTWNTAIAKTIQNRYTLQLGVENLFDFTRPGDLSYLPGRKFYAKFSLQLY
ncbi:TonB-dependent receptor [Fodinibius halophilus]|uniref:TonB-dependent receptor n=1 Tax=Fodinibius halophilus TaxID=1736908 RepID=A0A6M1T155_9BACT|nr:TonB-dependent receptor [Fodinibius halophilus]NGP87699.1 TonB-dependent receptor [Fodinibius halophilus]